MRPGLAFSQLWGSTANFQQRARSIIKFIGDELVVVCRGNDQYGRGRYFQHDDRQADPSGGAYSDGYEGPSFFKREERQQRQRRRCGSLI